MATKQSNTEKTPSQIFRDALTQAQERKREKLSANPICLNGSWYTAHIELRNGIPVEVLDQQPNGL